MRISLQSVPSGYQALGKAAALGSGKLQSSAVNGRSIDMVSAQIDNNPAEGPVGEWHTFPIDPPDGDGDYGDSEVIHWRGDIVDAILASDEELYGI